MKSVKQQIVTLILVSLTTAAVADTYVWRDGNGQLNFSDRVPAKGRYEVRHHPNPVDTPAQVPVAVRNVPVSMPAPLAAYAAADQKRFDMMAADATSAIQERDRKKALECLSIKQRMSRISSSRNFTVDPDTGRSLEERSLREAQETYDTICNG